MPLLTPKSVNNMLNTKVQRCGRHQVNPMGGEDEGEARTMRMGARSGWRQEAIDAIKMNHR